MRWKRLRGSVKDGHTDDSFSFHRAVLGADGGLLHLRTQEKSLRKDAEMAREREEGCPQEGSEEQLWRGCSS